MRREIDQRIPLVHWEWLRPLADYAAWIGGISATVLMSANVAAGRSPWRAVVVTAALAGVVQLLALSTVQHYRGRYRPASFEEVRGILVTVAAVCVVTVAVRSTDPDLLVPATALLPGATFAVAIMCSVRYVVRWRSDARKVGHPEARAALVFGAGEGGAQLIRAMRRDRRQDYVPTALLDDDPRKRNLRIEDVRVVGTRQHLVEAARRYGADLVVIAVPSADSTLFREITEIAEAAQLTVKVLPSLGDLLSKPVSVRDIRDVNLLDLLGRRPVTTDVSAIARYIRGKRILVTGAGGSIGSALCRAVGKYQPGRLIMLDRDESALHSVQLSIEGRALLDSPDVVLADIRDTRHLVSVFEDLRPQVVFHAAALKHLPLLERYPGESIKTNVWGTLDVMQCAAAVGVERFVNISTDKAANPVSALGYSKRITERLAASFAYRHGRSFMSVRFGNVLGSRGSVITAFAAQIARGGPVTVTHPEVTRYFMLVEEAVELVIQGGAVGRGGEVLVLDMGEPVRIADVAYRMAKQSGVDIPVEFSGLRPGEKLHEELFGPGERGRKLRHPLISHVPVAPLDPVAARALDPWSPPELVLKELRDFAAAEMPAESRWSRSHVVQRRAGERRLGDRRIHDPGPFSGSERRRADRRLADRRTSTDAAADAVEWSAVIRPRQGVTAQDSISR